MAIQDGTMMSQKDKDLYSQKAAMGLKITQTSQERGDRAIERKLDEMLLRAQRYYQNK